MNDAIDSTLGALDERLRKLVRDMYEYPELGNKEFFAAGEHKAILSSLGFNVEAPYMGVETGYLATYDTGKAGPTLAFLAEYDALPEVGHACGHNLIGAVAIGAGAALKEVLPCGRIRVYGTPAEETNGAKIIYAEQGAFSDVDAALMAHPTNQTRLSGASLAIRAVEFAFIGRASQAAIAPHMGIDALQAAIGMFNAVNSRRIQFRADARVYGILTEGGVAANIVCSRAVARFYVRAASTEYVNELVSILAECAAGAAGAIGARIEQRDYELAMDNLVTNETMSATVKEEMIRAGFPSVAPGAYPAFGSSDMGNVSRICPSIHPYFDITDGAAFTTHDPAFAACTVTELAFTNMRRMAGALARTALRLAVEDGLLAAVKKEFNGE